MKKMKKMSKRGLALLMSLLMCVSMLNLTAFADESETPADHSHNAISCATCGGAGTVDQTSDCPDCDGPAEVEWTTCEECGGKGTVTEKIFSWDNPPCPNGGYACNGCEDCRFGYAWVYEEVTCEVCNGEGKFLPTDVVACATCGGTGSITEPVDCEACEGGQVSCTGAFGEGVLTAVNADGTGTKNFTCATCGAEYTETIPVEEIAPMLASNISVNDISAPAATGKGKAAEITISVKNNNQVAISGVSVTVSLGGLEVDGAQDGVVTLTTDEIPAGQTSELIINAKVPDDAAKGTAYTASVTDASYNGVALASGQSATVKVITTYKNNVMINGGRLAYWLGYVPGTAEQYESRGNLGVLEDEPATFSSIMPNLYIKDWTEQFVTNYSTSKTWQCIGFVPNEHDSLYLTALEKFVYGTGFQPGGKSAAEALITSCNGVFYGETITGDKLSAWDTAFDGSRMGLVAVWYIPDNSVTDPSVNATPAPITPVVTETEEPSSTGVIVTFANKNTMKYIHQNKANGVMHGGYDAQIVITITPDAPIGDVHINLDKALKEIKDKINEIGGDHFEPGDEIRISVTMDNQSGREYTYKDRTILVSTKDLEITEDNGTEVIEGAEAFDGNKIPSVSKDEFAIIPRRILNVPLQELLGKDNNNTSDESIGEKLAAMGYGQGEGLDAAQIAQKYLGTYYLDWTNAVRATKNIAEKATSLQDLTAEEALVFTNGANGTQTKETSSSVAEGLYHFYYGKVFSVNEISVYDHMVNYNKGKNNESGYDDRLNNSTASLLTNGVLNLIGAIAGEGANNAFQNTRFGFRVEFDLTLVPTNTPTPPPVVITRNLTVNKVWVGDEEAEDARPDSIQVQLYQGGTAQGSPVTLNAANGWSHTWVGLSTVGDLTVEELNVPDGYIASTEISGSTVTITNTFEEDEIEDPDTPLGTPKPTPTPTPDPGEDIDDPDTPLGTPKPTPTPTPDPGEDIEDPDVPLGPGPEEPTPTPVPTTKPTPVPEEEIPDSDVPLANTPKTGDDTNVWFLLTVISAAGLVFLGASEWKKRKGDHKA